jgi:hypothetical protein
MDSQDIKMTGNPIHGQNGGLEPRDVTLIKIVPPRKKLYVWFDVLLILSTKEWALREEGERSLLEGSREAGSF